MNAPEDEERWILERVRYLTRATDLREPVAEALAWRELGYSQSGIAERVDATESTVESQLAEVVAEFGRTAVETRTDDFARDLHPGERVRDVAAIYQCPQCGETAIVPIDGVERIYPNPSGKLQDAVEEGDGTHVCTGCYAALDADLAVAGGDAR